MTEIMNFSQSMNLGQRATPSMPALSLACKVMKDCHGSISQIYVLINNHIKYVVHKKISETVSL